MDVELAKTFIEIVNTGSFVRAAERLNVTQTTVSARVRSLESRLGRRLFVRNKAGAALTNAGKQFLSYAPTLVQLWQRACHQVAIPEGHRTLLTVGSELTLWNPLLLNWVLRMRATAPDIALRTDVGVADELMRQVAAGVLDIAILYRPQKLPGLRIEELVKEKLVLVTTSEDKRPKSLDYVYVDWGSRFVTRHDMSFPDLVHSGLYVNLGPLGLSYILTRGGSGYFRMRTARPFLRTGRLRLVRGAPEYAYPVHAVYSVEGDENLLGPGLAALRAVAAKESDEWPIEAIPLTIGVSKPAGGKRPSRSRKRRAYGGAAAGRTKRR
jgi:DNA-binding transcriptional LysR family regulator